MSGLKRNIPIPTADTAAYKLLLKKEAMKKPALVTRRKEILDYYTRANYKNEYDRLQGLLEGHADRFSLPGGHWEKDKLVNRQHMLKNLFKDSYDGEKHPIMKK
jgi:hypothetical protein